MGEGESVVVPQDKFIGGRFLIWRLIIASYRCNAGRIPYQIKKYGIFPSPDKQPFPSFVSSLSPLAPPSPPPPV